MNTPAVLCLAAIGLALMPSASSGAAPIHGLEAVYRGFRVEHAALSPDGQRVAFVAYTERGTELEVFKTDKPGPKVTVPVNTNRTLETLLVHWVSNDQILTIDAASSITIVPLAGKPRSIDASQLVPKPPSGAAPPAPRVSVAPDDPACLLLEFLYRDQLNETEASPTADSSTTTLAATALTTDASANDATAPETAATTPTSDSATESASSGGGGGSSGGRLGRPMILQLFRLNVLTGKSQRLVDYDVEEDTKPGSLVVDRQGQPRIVARRGAEPPHYAYRLKLEEMSALRRLGEFLIGDDGWTDFASVLRDRKALPFSLSADAILSERAIPLGFDADPNILLYASNVGRDTFGIYAVDLRTAQRTALAIEEPGIDLVDPESPWTHPLLTFDPHRGTLAGVRLRDLSASTRWLDPELGRMQKEIEGKFPGRRVQLISWDAARECFLMLVGGFSDPGRYFVYHRATGRSMEFLKRGPAVALAESNLAEAFNFITPAGVRLTGTLTLPRNPPQKKATAVIVSLHGGPWERIEPGYDRDTQALATLGFVVVRINYRGSAGFGLAHREAIRTALDKAPLEDVIATLTWLRNTKGLDTRRVGLLGDGYGGYLALRGLQLHPELFHAAVAINALTTPETLATAHEPPMTTAALPTRAQFKRPGERSGARPQDALGRWLIDKQPGLGRIDVTSNLDRFTQPVFLLHNPNHRDIPFNPISDLRASLRRRKQSPEWMELSSDFDQMNSEERIDAFRKIAEFYNLNLYKFTVNVGEATRAPEPSAPEPSDAQPSPSP
ncbi:MAG: prolyl oligopeptidase family serine peptidase [Opitutaceae bacterium]